MKSYGKILRELRERANYGQVQVARMLQERGHDVTNTHVSRWENGYNNPTVEQFILLCALYGVRDVYEVFGMENPSGAGLALNREGIELLTAYRDLIANSGWFAEDEEGSALDMGPAAGPSQLHRPRELRNAAARAQHQGSGLDSSRQDHYEQQAIREIPVYTIGPSAGTRNPFRDEVFDMMPVEPAAPPHAEFAVHVDNNTMEPVFGHGDVVYAVRGEDLEHGDIGVVSLNGDAYVKMVHDRQGHNRRLMSANPAYAPIEVGNDDEFVVHGKVIHPAVNPGEIVAPEDLQNTSDLTEEAETAGEHD